MISVPRSRYILHSERGLALPHQATTIGEKLRKKRAALKIQQTELARMLRVSTVSISRWECDIGVIRRSHLEKIDSFLRSEDPLDALGEVH